MRGFLNPSEGFLIAIHSLIIMAQEKDGVTSSKLVSQLFGTSNNTVSKVLQRLVRANLVTSERGPKGGFALSKQPSLVSFYDVYRVIEGEPGERGCYFGRESCPIGECIFGNTVAKLETDFKRFLSERKLSHYVTKRRDRYEAKNHQH
jgi:Rrf2 family protein